MAIRTAALLPFFAAFWFFASAAYLGYKRRQAPDLLGSMTPVALYLVGVPLGLPVLFAVLAPLSLVAVLAFVARVETMAVRGDVDPDASSRG